MAPVTRHSARGNVPGASQRWDSHRTQSIATLVKTRKHRKLKEPDKQREGNPGTSTSPTPARPPTVIDIEMSAQAPFAVPDPRSPNEQLDLELSKHANIALQVRAMREKEEDKETLEVLAILDKKVSSMNQKSLPRASSFGNALQTFVCNYFAQPSPSANARVQYL